MNSTTPESDPLTSSSTARRRSSNWPRNLAPAISAPRSRAIKRKPCNESGTSPATIRCASSWAIAVLPTPGSPIRTGLFLLRRDRTLIRLRISPSRPTTGSKAPPSASAVRSRPYNASAEGSCSNAKAAGASGVESAETDTDGADTDGTGATETGPGETDAAGTGLDPTNAICVGWVIGTGPRNRRSNRSDGNPSALNSSAPMRGSIPMAAISEGTSIRRSPQRARTPSALSNNCSRSSPINRSSTRADGWSASTSSRRSNRASAWMGKGSTQRRKVGSEKST